MGGSGCGKSTLLKHMLGLIVPATGDILYNGAEFRPGRSAGQEAMRRRWGITYQSGGLFSAMTLARECGPAAAALHRLPRQRRDRGYRGLQAGPGRPGGLPVLLPLRDQRRHAQAGGTGRAIALDPEILFFDEPSAGLDPISSRLLDDLIVQLQESTGATVVMVTHELASIFAIATNSVFLDRRDSRTMIDYGDPRQLRDHSKQAVVRQFLTRGGAGETSDRQRTSP